jgi:hypothetical protein
MCWNVRLFPGYHLRELAHMPIRAVNSELFVGDEGRFIYCASLFHRQPYYIPADDIQALDRRRTWWLVAGFVTYLTTLAGAGLGIWSVWWCVVGIPALLLPSAAVGRWVRERYEPVSDPSIAVDARRTAVLRGPTVGAVVFALVFAGLQFGSSLGRHRTSAEYVLFFTVLAAQVVRLFQVKRGRDEFGDGYIPPTSTLTR